MLFARERNENTKSNKSFRKKGCFLREGLCYKNTLSKFIHCEVL